MPIKATHHQNNCTGQCVAYFFNLHPHRIPCFAKGADNFPVFLRRVQAFFRRRGYRLSVHPYSPRLLKGRGLYLVQGLSPESPRYHHMVVYKGRRRHWDCHHERKFLKGRPLYVFIATRIKE